MTPMTKPIWATAAGSVVPDTGGSSADIGYLHFVATNSGGRRRRKYVTGKTRREVAARLREAATARDAGTLVVTQSGQTVGEWLEFWLESIAAAKVRPSTLHSYRGYLRNRIVPALGRHRLDRLQPERLEAFYRQSLDEGLAPATAHTARSP